MSSSATLAPSIMQSSNKQISRKIAKLFYQEQLYEIVHECNIFQSYSVSRCLLFFRYFFIILFINPYDESLESSKKMYLSDVLHKIRLSTETVKSEALILFFLFLNLMILILFLLSTFKFFTLHKVDRDSEDTYSSNLLNIPSITKPLSYVLSVYPSIIIYASVATSFSQIPSAPSILNIILTLLFGIICKDVDYDYLISTQNKLARPYRQNWGYLSLFTKICLAFIVQYLPSSIQPKEFGLISFIVFELLHSYFHPYYDSSIQQWKVFLKLFFLGISILNAFTDNPTQLSSMFIISVLIMIPLTYQLSQLFTKLYYQNMIDKLNKSATSLSIEQVDLLMRQINLSMASGQNSEYTNWEDSQIKFQLINSIFEDIAQNDNTFVLFSQEDRSSLSIASSDFLKAVDNYNQSQTQSVLSECTREMIQKMIDLGLKVLFEKILFQFKNSRSPDFKIPYIVFLMEKLHQSKQFWIEYQKSLIVMTKKSNDTQLPRMNLKRIQILNTLKRSQQSPFRFSTFSNDFIDVINYENRLNRVSIQFAETLRLKVNVMLSMRNRIINLEDLIESLSTYFLNREELKSSMNYLFKIHGTNIRLQSLQGAFVDTMAISDFDLVGYGKKKQKQKEIKRQMKVKIASDSFDPSTCIVTAEYKDSCELIIKHVSENFFKIFPSDQRFIAGKSIDVILPNFLRPVHPKFVRNFIFKLPKPEEGNPDDDYRKKLIFAGIENSVILIPMWIEIKLNQFFDSDTFGMCAKISCENKEFPTATTNNYIIYDSNTSNLVGVTKQIKKIAFSTKQQKYQKNSKDSQKFNVLSYFPLIAAATFPLPPQKEENEDDWNEEDEENDQQKNQLQRNHQIRNYLSHLSQGTSAQTLFVKKSMNPKDKSQNNSDSLNGYLFYLLTIKHRQFEVQHLEHLNVIEITHVALLSAKQYPSTISTHLKTQLVLADWMTEHSSTYSLSSSQVNPHQSLNYFKQGPKISSQTLKDLITMLPNQKGSKKSKKEEIHEMNAIQFTTFGGENESSQLLDNRSAQRKIDASTSYQTNEAQKPSGILETDIQNNSFASAQADTDINNGQKTFNYKNSQRSDQFISQKSINNVLEVPGSKRRIESNLSSETLATQNLNITRNLLPDSNNESNSNIFNDRDYQNPTSTGMKQSFNFPLSPEYQERSLVGELMDSKQQQKMIKKQQNNFLIDTPKRIIYSEEMNQESIQQPQNKLQQIIVQNSLESKIQDTEIINHHNIEQSTAQQQQYYGFESERYTVICSNTERSSSFAFQALKPKNLYRNTQQQAKEDKHKPQTTYENTNNQLNQKKLQEEIGSQASSKKSSMNNARRLLKQIISDRNTPFVIRFSTWIGLVSYLSIILIISISFQNLNEQINSSKEDQIYSTWPIDYQTCVNTIVKDSNLGQILNYNDFLFDSEEQKQNLSQMLKENQFQQNMQAINLISQSSGYMANRLVFNRLRNTPNTFRFGQYYNPTTIKGSPSLSEKDNLYSIPFNTSIYYSIILSYQHTFRYASRIGIGRAEYYMLLNNLNFNQALSQVEDDILIEQKDNDEQLQSNLSQIMAITIGVSAICLSVIIPLFVYVQFARQEVIALFSTFSQQAIGDILEDTQRVYENIVEHLHSSSLINFKKTGRAEDLRKNSKNTSETTSLPKANLSLFLIVAIVFLLIVIQPILNKTATSSYLNNEALSIRTAINLYTVKGYIAKLIALNYNEIVTMLYPDIKSTVMSTYQQALDELISQSDLMQLKIQTILEEQNKYTRFHQQEYDEYFFEILKSNICLNLNKMPQYLSNKTWVESVNCQTIQSGFLTSGFQISLKNYLEVFPLLNTMFQQSSNTKLKEFASHFNLKDFTEYEQYLEETLTAMRTFMFEVSQTNYERITLIQFILYCYQVFLLTFIFLFGWLRFSQKLKVKLIQSKQYLQIIDILQLLNNNYVLSYIKKNISV